MTGGTGSIGRSVLRWLQDADSQQRLEVTVLSRNPAVFLERHPEFNDARWLRFQKGDVLDPASFPLGDFDGCIHAAAQTREVRRIDVIGWFDEIVAGTRNILEWATRQSVSRVLFLSSGAVYGPQPVEMEAIAETCTTMPDPLLASNVYGVSKRSAEHLCALYGVQHGIQVVTARLFAFVGRDFPLSGHFAIGNFIRDALTREAITVSGDGTPLRSYLDQADLADWLLTLLERGRPGEAYNLGSDVVVSIAELAHLVRDLLAPDKPVRMLGTATCNTGLNRYVPDIRKVRDELGLHVTIPLAEAIRRTAVAHGWEAAP